MTISQRCVVLSIGLLVALGQTVAVDAQVIDASTPTSDEGVQTAVDSTETGEEKGGFLPVSWPSISLPQIKMPKITMPKISMPKWPTNTDGTSVSPMAPISAGASKVSAGSRKAWQGTKEMFSFASREETPRPSIKAKTPAKPSFWQRLTRKKPEPEGPLTVAEFMAQPRIR
jgi:hypothetical protein